MVGLDLSHDMSDKTPKEAAESFFVKITSSVHNFRWTFCKSRIVIHYQTESACRHPTMNTTPFSTNQRDAFLQGLQKHTNDAGRNDGGDVFSPSFNNTMKQISRSTLKSDIKLKACLDVDMDFLEEYGKCCTCRGYDFLYCWNLAFLF